MGLWKYLSEDLFCQVFFQSTNASFLLSTLNSFQGMLKWVAVAAHDLILVEVDGRKTSTSALLTTSKPLTFVDHHKLWKVLKEMRIPDHLTCLLRNLHAGQEATVRTGHGKTDWLQIGKGVRQGCILSPCLFNLYAEYIMRNTGLDETQAGTKIAGRNIKNLRYADDTTLWQNVKKN